MQDLKLISILKVLQKEEWHDLKKHILSITSTQSLLYSVFDFLFERRQQLDKLPDVGEVASTYYDGMTPKSLLNYCHLLHQHVDQWLTNSEMKKDQNLCDLFLYKSLNRRGLYEHAKFVKEQLRLKYYGEKGFSLERSHIQFQIEIDRYYNGVSDNFEHNFRSLYHSFNEYVEMCYTFLELEKKAIFKFLNIDLSQEEEFNKLTVNEPTQYLQKVDELILISSEERISTLFQHLKDGHIDEKSIVFQNSCKYLINLSFAAWAQDKLTDGNLLVDIYLFSLEKEAILKNGKLSLPEFNNLMAVYSSVKSFEETDQCINLWINKTDIPKPKVKLVKNMANITNLFYHQKYVALKLKYVKSDFSTLTEKLRASLYYLIALYETDDPMFKLHFKRIEAAIKRSKNKTTPGTYLRLWNLSQFIKDLSQGFKPRISDYLPIINKKWCLSKVVS